MPIRRLVVRASHIIAYQDGGHCYLRDGVIVIEGNTITQVGRRFAGAADEIIDATDKIVTPGLLSCHAHLAGSPLDKSFIEDVGPRNFYMSGLFEMLPTRAAAQDEQSSRACIDFSMAELVKTGCTTVVELGGGNDYTVQRAGSCGVRLYIGPSFRSGRWFTDDGKTVQSDWDETAWRLTRNLQAAGERMWAAMKGADRIGRNAPMASRPTSILPFLGDEPPAYFRIIPKLKPLIRCL